MSTHVMLFLDAEHERQLKCGECGGDTFSLIHVREPGEPDLVVMKCQKCFNESIITMSADVKLDNNLCGGW